MICLHLKVDKPWSEYFTPVQHHSDIMTHLMRLWYLSHRRPAKAQASLCIRAVSPEPSLRTHMKYGNRRRVRPKIKHLAPLDDCAFEEWVYRGQKVPQPLKLVIIYWFDTHITDTALPTTWYMKVHWIVFNIINTVSVIVTLLYYALLNVGKCGFVSLNLTHICLVDVSIFINSTGPFPLLGVSSVS